MILTGLFTALTSSTEIIACEVVWGLNPQKHKKKLPLKHQSLNKMSTQLIHQQTNEWMKLICIPKLGEVPNGKTIGMRMTGWFGVGKQVTCCFFWQFVSLSVSIAFCLSGLSSDLVINALYCNLCLVLLHFWTCFAVMAWYWVLIRTVPYCSFAVAKSCESQKDMIWIVAYLLVVAWKPLSTRYINT